MADGDTVADKIANIAASKAAIAQAISSKGVAVPEGAKLADLAPLVEQISGGGGAADTCTIDRDTMTELVIPEGATKIGNTAFSGCTALTSLTIPGSVTSIGDDAFSGCIALTSLTIPGSVMNIGGLAFSGCRALTSLTIPGSVMNIGIMAFSSCSALTSLTIPGSVKNIGRNAFYGCPATCEIIFAKPMVDVTTRADYPWGIPDGATIHCTDGDLSVASSLSSLSTGQSGSGDQTGNATTYDQEEIF